MTGGGFAKAKELYKIATNTEFINSVKDTADFDENGQITAHSFFSLSGLSSEIDDVLDTLKREDSKTNLTDEELLDSVVDFNKNESYKEKYIPQVSQQENDKFSLSFTDRTTESTDDLQKKLEDVKLTSLIAKRLRELGVAYDFVGKSQHAGRFSTKNAQKMSDGLYHLVELSTGADPVDTLVEEAAHLATVSMKDNSVIQRLLSMINENTIHDLFTDEEIETAQLNTEDGKLELAGLLVKKAMLKKRIIGFDNFMSRVKNAIFNVFSKLKLDTLLSDKTRAKLYAQQIANGFLYDQSTIDAASVENAVETTNKELFSISLTGTNKLLQKSLQRLSELAGNIRNSSIAIWDTLLSDIKPGKLMKGKDIDSLTYEEASGIICTGLSNLLDSFKLIMSELNGINFDGDISQEELLTLYSATEMYTTIVDLCKMLNSYKLENPDESSEIIEELNKAIDSVRSYFANEGNISDKILDSQRLVTAQIFGQILGSKSYEESARVIFKKLRLQVRKERSYSTIELATKYIHENAFGYINRITNLIRHYNNAEDVTTQLFYQAIRRLKINESRRYKESLSELADIEKAVHKSNINIIDFYQRYDDGSFTGYFIGEYNLAQFEQDKNDVLNKIKKDFLDELKDSGDYEEYMKMTKAEKNQVFENYRDSHSLWQDFLDEAYVDKETRTLSEKYKDARYQNLINEYDDFEYLLNRIKNWKSKLDDACLRENIDDEEGGGSYKLYVQDLIPQYRAGAINRIKNKRLIKDTDLYDERHVKEINLDITSEEFGCPIMDTSLNEFNDEISLTSDAVRRIPLYGINKLSDMRDLSTNLFESLSVYASMAHKYHSTQELYPQLKILDSTLKNRDKNEDIGEDIKYQNISDEARKKMLDDYIYQKQKKIHFVTNFFAKLGMIASIRVLCLNIMSALKNWNGGYRVIFNDAISGNGNFSLRDLLSATKRNFNPIHTISSLATIYLNKEQTWDKYQNLIRRWDAARNPHVHTTVGSNGLKKAFNYVTNIIMQNYSLTDESLIAIIYDAHMGARVVYDAETGNKINLNTEGYIYDSNNNPSLKTTLIKDKKDIELWKKLKSALEAIEYIIDNNKTAEKDDEKLRLDDRYEIVDLLDYIENYLNQSIPVYNESGGFKSIEEVKTILEEKLNDISFTEEDEVKLCEQINDYITSSQGLYGALNANAIQSNAELAMFSKLKGWLFGFMQRNLLSNPSALSGDYKASVYGSELLALACIFGNTKHITGSYDWRDNLKFKAAILAAMFVPFALVNTTNKKSGSKAENKLREYLSKSGWSPDQLNKFSFFIVGGFIQWGIRLISSKLLSRGNWKKFGDYTKRHPLNRKGKKVNLKNPGLLFPKSALVFNENKYNEDYKKWSKPDSNKHKYPYTLNQKVNIDGRAATYSSLPSVTQDNVDKFKNRIYKVLDNGKYYQIDYKDGKVKRKYTWKEKAYGYYTPGTEEWNEHVAAMRYSNYGYDTQSLAYYWVGAAYRLSRGVQDEGESLVNPIKMVGDIKEMSSPIISSIFSVVFQGVNMAINQDLDTWGEKEINFWLNKFGMQLDGDGYPMFNKDGEKQITLLDWYEKQDQIDRYQSRMNILHF